MIRDRTILTTHDGLFVSNNLLLMTGALELSCLAEHSTDGICRCQKGARTVQSRASKTGKREVLHEDLNRHGEMCMYVARGKPCLHAVNDDDRCRSHILTAASSVAANLLPRDVQTDL